MMDNLSFLIKTGTAAAAGFAVAVFGGADAWFKALLAVIILDYITGVLGAFVQGTLSSRTGGIGIAKKMVILAIVAMGTRLDLVLGANGILRSIVIGFYVANDALSILENAVEMGVPVPKPLVDKLEQLKDVSSGNSAGK